MDVERHLYMYRFIDLILEENTAHAAGSRGHATWAKAHRSLQHHPEQLSSLLTNARYRYSFLTNFEKCVAARIITFLQSTDSFLPRTPDGYLLRRTIGTITAERLLLPLLEQEQYHQLRGKKLFFDLLLHTLLLADQHSGNRLHRIAACLPNSPTLMGKLLSSDQSAGFLAQWVESLGRGNPHAPTLAAWTEAIATLCDTCGLGHDNQDVLDKWASVKMLRDQLHDQARAQTSILLYNPDLTGELSFPKEIREILENFGLPIPTSGQLVATLIEQVEVKLTSEVLSSLVKSMPCKICFTRLTDKDGSYVSMKSRLRQISVTSVDDFDHDHEITGPFEKLLGNRLGTWKVVLSGQALKDLQQSKSEGNFECIKNKLIGLSTGDWIRKSVAKPVSLDHINLKVRLFEAEYGADGRILWQVDVGYDESLSSASQIVRVWRIGQAKEVEKAYDLISRTQNAWSSRRISDCKSNNIDKKKAIKIPVVFIDHLESIETSEKTVGPTLFENRTPQDILISSKFHILTNIVFDNILHDNDYAEYPFDVSSKEVGIIRHFKTAAFVLGRSGTGKTTCLVYKLLSRYLASAQYVGTENRLRQVLLTRSEPLARKLKLDLYRLIKAQLIARGELKELAKTPSEETLEASPEITLGGKSLFSLQSEDFPLVCTFGEFISLVENTIRAHDRQNFYTARETGSAVDFTVFKAAYWPKIGTKGSDSGLVYSEIMGVIKGTVSFTSTNFSSLSRQEYVTRSDLASAFATESERNKVYAVFEGYEVLKAQRREYDSIDKIVKFLNAIRQPSMQRKLFDIIQEIYVDEVQDQRGLEIELLLNLVQKPRGIHFAGDSAQCISNDSAFRFSNIKALFYNHYSHLDPGLAKPVLFPLSRNFRSHQGILSFASFIMELLWKGFPKMVDKLPPEIGQFLGPKPIIFVGSDVDKLLVRVGGLNSAQNQQTIIVRNEETGIALQTKLKSNSIIYTILQSKGMEYDDVYLYDFFSSSPYPPGWRTLGTLLPEGANSDSSYTNKHLTMCSELKNLYVAITRARSRLWILEPQSNAFIQLLASMPEQLVDVRSLDLDNVEFEDFLNKLCPMQTATTRAEWNHTGEQCMDQRLYSQALKCFQNSGDEGKQKWARACIAEERGKEHRARGDIDLFKKQFRKAADNFLAINRNSKAAECLEALDEFAKAAELWSMQRRFEQAGILYERAGRAYIPQAAKEYYKAKLPMVVLNLYLQSGMYKEAVEDLTRHQKEISVDERKTLAQQLNSLLRQGKIPKRFKKQTFDLLLTDQEKQEFLRNFGYFDELWNFLAERNKLDEALNELIGAAELDLLLKNAFRADPKWQEMQQERLGEIYHCINSRKLFAAIEVTSKPESVDVVCETISKATYTRAIWAQEWNNMWRVVEDQIKRRSLPAKAAVDNENQRSIDFLTAILIHYPDFFTVAIETTSQLITILELLQSMSQTTTKLKLPSAVTTCIGLLSINEGGYWPLPLSVMTTNYWKPTMQQQSVQQQRVTVTEVNRHLRNKFQFALETILQKTKVNVLRTLRVCSRCIPKDNWDFAKPKILESQNAEYGCCPIQSWANFRNNLRDIVKICQLLGKISETGALERMTLYKKDTGFVNKSTASLTSRINADFISELILILSYESSYSHDAATMLQTAKRISEEQQYELIRENIKHQIHMSKVNEPTWSQDDLFWLFRNHRVFTMLNIPFEQLISTSDRSEKREAKVGFHLEIFRCYHELQSLPANGKFSTMADITRKFIDNLRTFAYSKRLVSYDAELISLFEDIGTLLLFTGWQTEILVPKSWRERYLPHWIKYLGKSTKKEQTQCQKALSNLIILFSEVVDWLEDRGRRIDNKQRVFLTRRSLDFLIVMLINTRMTDTENAKENPEIDHHRIFSAVQAVLRKRSLPTQAIQGVPHDQLIQPLLNAFDYYNGKDHLCLYLCRNRQGIPISASRRWLNHIGVEISSRPTCDRNHQGCGSMLMKSLPSDSSLVMTILRMNAANLIRRAFRNYKSRRTKLQVAAKVILKYYKNIYLPRRAAERLKATRVTRMIEAQKVIRRAYLIYKWNKDFRYTQEYIAVQNLQAAFAQQRKQHPKLNRKEYYILLITMLTQGIELCIHLALLEEKCEILLQQARTQTQNTKIIKSRRKIIRLRDELCRHSDKFQVLNLTQTSLQGRISAGMEFVKEGRDSLDAVASTIRNQTNAAKQATEESKRDTPQPKESKMSDWEGGFGGPEEIEILGMLEGYIYNEMRRLQKRGKPKKKGKKR